MTKKIDKGHGHFSMSEHACIITYISKKITKAFRMKFRIKLRRNDIAHSIWTCILQGLKFTIHVVSI